MIARKIQLGLFGNENVVIVSVVTMYQTDLSVHYLEVMRAQPCRDRRWALCQVTS